MIIRLTADALADIKRVRDFLASYDAAVADRGMAHIHKVLGTLPSWPLFGRAGHRSGTRESLVSRMPYLVVYRIDLGTEDELVVLRILHVHQPC